MKNRIATIVMVSILGVTGVGLVSCGESSSNQHYTGDAVISGVNYRSKSKLRPSACIATVNFPDGGVVERRIHTSGNESKRGHCYKVKTGGKVTLVDGQIVSFELKD